MPASPATSRPACPQGRRVRNAAQPPCPRSSGNRHTEAPRLRNSTISHTGMRGAANFTSAAATA